MTKWAPAIVAMPKRKRVKRHFAGMRIGVLKFIDINQYYER